MTTIKNYAKMGFGFTGGSMFAQIIFMVIGLTFFLIGMRMLAGARKEGKSPVPAYVFMGIGMIVGLGLGAGLFFENVSKNMGMNK